MLDMHQKWPHPDTCVAGAQLKWNKYRKWEYNIVGLEYCMEWPGQKSADTILQSTNWIAIMECCFAILNNSHGRDLHAINPNVPSHAFPDILEGVREMRPDVVNESVEKGGNPPFLLGQERLEQEQSAAEKECQYTHYRVVQWLTVRPGALEQTVCGIAKY